MLVVALSGMVLLGGAALLDQVADARDRLAHQALAQDERANGERLLRQLVRNSVAGADSAERFTGNARSASFLTACTVPAGWRERCRMLLLIDSLADTSRVLLQLPDESMIALGQEAEHERFVYLDRVGGGRRVLTAWGTSIALPAAVGIVIASDTVWLPTGTR
jgi:hypothetical protein